MATETLPLSPWVSRTWNALPAETREKPARSNSRATTRPEPVTLRELKVPQPASGTTSMATARRGRRGRSDLKLVDLMSSPHLGLSFSVNSPRLAQVGEAHVDVL